MKLNDCVALVKTKVRGSIVRTIETFFLEGIITAVTPGGSPNTLAEVTSWLNWRVFVSVFQSVVFQRFDEDVWVGGVTTDTIVRLYFAVD